MELIDICSVIKENKKTAIELLDNITKENKVLKFIDDDNMPVITPPYVLLNDTDGIYDAEVIGVKLNDEKNDILFLYYSYYDYYDCTENWLSVDDAIGFTNELIYEAIYDYWKNIYQGNKE